MNIGDKVKIERDEKLYPSKGTWPRFRGKTGTIVEISQGEYGVCFSKVTQAPAHHNRVLDWIAKDVAWFLPHEIVPVASQRPVYGQKSPSLIEDTREVLIDA
jgi:hypothetical protein